MTIKSLLFFYKSHNLTIYNLTKNLTKNDYIMKLIGITWATGKAN